MRHVRVFFFSWTAIIFVINTHQSLFLWSCFLSVLEELPHRYRPVFLTDLKCTSQEGRRWFIHIFIDILSRMDIV